MDKNPARGGCIFNPFDSGQQTTGLWPAFLINPVLLFDKVVVRFFSVGPFFTLNSPRLKDNQIGNNLIKIYSSCESKFLSL